MNKPSQQLPLKKKLIYATVTVVALVVVPLLALEIACRMHMWIKHGVPGKSYGIYKADKEIGAVHRPNSYNSNSVINNFGLRNVEDITAAKPAGITRIYCSGGSTTYCYNLVTAEAWPSKLQNQLRQEPGRERDEVLNAGEICFSISHEFALARRMLPLLKPDIAILFTGVNEGMMGEQFERQAAGKLDELLASQTWSLPPTNLDQARFWKRNSAVTRLWDYYIKSWFEPKLTESYRDQDSLTPPPGHPSMHPYIMLNLDKTLLAYLQFIREQGAVPVILRFGDNGMQSWYMNEGIRKWRERAVEIARQQGVIICDAATVFEQHPRRAECFLSSGVHVTELGAAVLAEELKKTLLALPPK